MNRRRMACAALGVLAASTLLGGPARAQSDEPPTLGGYTGSAHTSGIHVFYNPQNVLPTAAILDAGSPDALATIASGPVTFARAAVADPGDLLVNPDALFTQADPSYPQGTIPPYPFRITATSTVGEPRAESKPAPGLDAEVEATPEGSTSESTVGTTSAPGVLSVGSVASRALTTFDGTGVEVRARTEVTGFSFLGLLEVESIVTEVVARSSGGETEREGSTVITGATFMDQPVVIDEQGIRQDPDAEEPDVPLLAPVVDALPADLTKALADAGIRVILPGPIEQSAESTGTVGSTGLRIELELSERTAPALNELLGTIPVPEVPIPGAPGLADAVVLLRATHVSAIEVGRAQAALTARPGFVAPTFDSPIASGTGTPIASTPPAAALSPPIARTPSPTPDLPAEAADGTSPVVTAGTTAPPPASLGAGIGALAVLALLAQPFFGDRIARLGAAVLATGPAETCPLAEEP